MGSGPSKAPASQTASAAEKFTGQTTGDEVAALWADRAKGKTILVTSANCGLGLETARELAAHGASVVIASRSPKNGEEAVKKIKAAHPDADVTTVQLDLSSFQSIRATADAYLASKRPLHILINNAGVMACPKGLTTDGYETQIGVNHLGHFLLTSRLLPVLAASGSKEEPSRVINLSSIGNWLFAPAEGVTLDDLKAEKSYNPWQRYGQSKVANIVHAKELNARCAAAGQPVIGMSLHPGNILDTNLFRGFDISVWGAMVSTLLWRPGGMLPTLIVPSPNKTIPQGVSTTVRLALDPAVVPGAYYSDCQLSDLVHHKGADKEFARKLWEASEVAVRG